MPHLNMFAGRSAPERPWAANAHFGAAPRADMLAAASASASSANAWEPKPVASDIDAIVALVLSSLNLK